LKTRKHENIFFLTHCIRKIIFDKTVQLAIWCLSMTTEQIQERIARIPVRTAGYEKEALNILEGKLTIADTDDIDNKNGKGIVIFAHGDNIGLLT
jgi:hypothetical protein